MLVVETTTRKRVDMVQGYNVTAKSLEKGDIVITKPRNVSSVLPNCKIKIIDGYKTHPKRMCDVPIEQSIRLMFLVLENIRSK